MDSAVSQVAGRVCRQCGMSIDHRAAKARFCSNECYHLHYYIVHRATKPVEFYVREERCCEQCGTSLDDKRVGARFCGKSCWAKYRYRSKRPTGRVCKRCGSSIDHRSMNAVYCSDRCRHRYSYFKATGRQVVDVPPGGRRCATCGVSIEERHGKATHCLTCRPRQQPKTADTLLLS